MEHFQRSQISKPTVLPHSITVVFHALEHNVSLALEHNVSLCLVSVCLVKMDEYHVHTFSDLLLTFVGTPTGVYFIAQDNLLVCIS